MIENTPTGQAIMHNRKQKKCTGINSIGLEGKKSIELDAALPRPQ